MNKTLLFSFLLFTSVISFAQNTARAKALLNEVSEKVASYENISLTFDYTLDNEQKNIHQETNGNIKIQGDKYHLKFMGSDRIYDGKNIYTIHHDDEEVIISSSNSEEEQKFTPSKILTFYQEGFTFQWDKLQNINGKKIQFIKLTPINSNAENQHILLGIDIRTKNIDQIIYTDRKGTNTAFKIRSFKTNIPFSANEFVFDQARYTDKDYMITRL